MAGERHLRLVPIIVFVAVVKVVNQNVYEDLLFGKIPFTTLCAQLRFTQLNEEGKNKVPLDRLINWVRFSMLSESEYHEVDQNDPIRKYDEKLWNYDVERKRLLPIFCQKLSMFNVN